MALRLARAAWKSYMQESAGARISGTMARSRRSVASTTSKNEGDATIVETPVGEVRQEMQDELKPGELGEASGAPKEHLRRKVVIYSPSRTASQQGRCNLGRWLIEHDTTHKWENPLMGWTSSKDPYTSLSEQAMTFDTKDAAVDFARHQGWEFVVREPHQQTLKPKAYADNFKWKGLPVMPDEA